MKNQAPSIRYSLALLFYIFSTLACQKATLLTNYTQQKPNEDLANSSNSYVETRKIEANVLGKEGSRIKIFLQLKDGNTVSYDDSLEKALQQGWCLVKDSLEMQEIPIENLTTTSIDSLPMALAFVIDNSDSMGEKRVLNAQMAVYELAKNKQKDDAFALINYSTRVKVEIPLTTDKALLMRALNPPKGLQGMGEKSSLLNASQKAIEVLQESNLPKAIVLFTDGQENNSTISQDSILALCKQKQIAIYALDYSKDSWDKSFSSLVSRSGGELVYIHEQGYFFDALKKLYRSKQKGYILSFDTKRYGTHQLTLRLCLPDTHIDTEIVFDNTPTKDTPALLDVYFDTAQWELKELSLPALENIYQLLAKNVHLKIEIRGHTDSVGNEQENLLLSEKRAEAVLQYLIAKGIASERLKAIGFGETKPIAENNTPEGRSKNRRTEFILR